MRITIFKTYYWLIHRCKIMVNMFSACECVVSCKSVILKLHFKFSLIGIVLTKLHNLYEIKHILCCNTG